MGNKAQRRKTRPRSSGRTETAPSLRRPGGCRDCGAAVQGVGPTPAGRLRPAPPSPPRRPEPPVEPRRPQAAPASSARPAERRRRGASSRGQGGRGRPTLRAGGCGRRLARAGSHPPLGALTSQCAHPGAGGAGSQSVCPEVERPASRATPWPGRARQSTGGSRPGAAPGRAAAAEQAGKRSSRRRAAAARRRDPVPTGCHPGPPHPSPEGVLAQNLRPDPVTAVQARRTSALGPSCAGSLEKLGATDRVGGKGSPSS